MTFGYIGHIAWAMTWIAGVLTLWFGVWFYRTRTASGTVRLDLTDSERERIAESVKRQLQWNAMSRR